MTALASTVRAPLRMSRRMVTAGAFAAFGLIRLAWPGCCNAAGVPSRYDSRLYIT